MKILIDESKIKDNIDKKLSREVTVKCSECGQIVSLSLKEVHTTCEYYHTSYIVICPTCKHSNYRDKDRYFKMPASYHTLCNLGYRYTPPPK